MQYLQKLPLLLALAAAFMSGLLGFIRQSSQKSILIQMTIVMTLFFVVGLFVRAMLTNIQQQIEQKKQEEQQEEMRKQMELEKERLEQEKGLGKNIDLKAGDMADEAFDPLPVSEFIKKELKSG